MGINKHQASKKEKRSLQARKKEWKEKRRMKKNERIIESGIKENYRKRKKINKRKEGKKE